MDRKKHWEEIYQSKNTTEVSWFQASPTTSLQFLKEFNLPQSASIIDVGGGDSFMVDELLEMGYRNITVLDISETAIKKAQQRLGDKAKTVKWIVADAAGFQPTETYDFWHDRAAFHFLTGEQEISKYVDTITNTCFCFFLYLFRRHSKKRFYWRDISYQTCLVPDNALRISDIYLFLDTYAIKTGS